MRLNHTWFKWRKALWAEISQPLSAAYTGTFIILRHALSEKVVYTYPRYLAKPTCLWKLSINYTDNCICYFIKQGLNVHYSITLEKLNCHIWHPSSTLLKIKIDIICLQEILTSKVIKKLCNEQHTKLLKAIK